MNELLIFLSGFQDPGGKRLSGKEFGGGFELCSYMKLVADSRSHAKFLGVSGTLNPPNVEDGWKLVRSFVNMNATPDGTIIIYGYSAGGNNALEYCRRIEQENRTRSVTGADLICVDLLFTVDAATRSDHKLGIDRTVAGCVTLNQNYYQTGWLNKASGGPTSCSGPGVGGDRPTIENTDCTDDLDLFEVATKHAQIENFTFSDAVDAIRDTLGP